MTPTLSTEDVRQACQDANEVFAEQPDADQCREVAEYMREVLLAIAERRQQQPRGDDHCDLLVVGVRISHDGFGSYLADPTMGLGSGIPGEVREPLCRLSDAQRLMAERDARIDSLMETFTKAANYLGIDTEQARKAPGKPSDVFIAHIDQLRARVGELTDALERIKARTDTFAEDGRDMPFASCQVASLIAERALNAKPAGEVES